MTENCRSLSDRLCSRCGGSGKIRYEHDHLAPDGEVVGHTSGTRACICVRDLPPIEGEATWWDSETLWEKSIRVGTDDVFEVVVSAEVPRREDGRRVMLRGNRYWPTLIATHGEIGGSLLADDLREIAAALVEACDRADARDKPCEDVCGHWWPCECAVAA